MRMSVCWMEVVGWRNEEMEAKINKKNKNGLVLKEKG